MPGVGRAEIYFISAMMILILVVCGVAVYAFFKTYRKEMKGKNERPTSADHKPGSSGHAGGAE